ncbi:hypothetical protein D3C76_1493160 [compost metagenome]
MKIMLSQPLCQLQTGFARHFNIKNGNVHRMLKQELLGLVHIVSLVYAFEAHGAPLDSRRQTLYGILLIIHQQNAIHRLTPLPLLPE